MSISEIKKQATEKMAKSVETLKHDLAKVRTGRAHTGLIDHLRVDYYGSEMPINQVANVTLSDARTISIQPFEKKMVQIVEKAIRDSDLGVNPATSGDVIRVPMPALTEERRKELAKKAHHMAEETRVEIRRFRHEGNDRIKKMFKDKEISEDDERRGLEEAQKLTDKKIAEVDDLLKAKEKEILAV